MSTTGLSTAYRRVGIVRTGEKKWKPFCWLIFENEKKYIESYKDIQFFIFIGVRRVINSMQSSYWMTKILIGTSFFIVGLQSVFDEDFNLLMIYNHRNIWIKYGAMISSTNEKSIVKYLKTHRDLNIIYVENFDDIYYNPTIRFKTRQDKANTEIELTDLCRELLN